MSILQPLGGMTKTQLYTVTGSGGHDQSALMPAKYKSMEQTNSPKIKLKIHSSR